MPKRLTDTDIWDKGWFTDLTPALKCLVKYAFDKCDLAGFWKPNIKTASIYIGETVLISDLTEMDEGRQFKIIDNKVFIPGFIPFQYGKLSMNSRVHKAVVDSLIKNNMSHIIENYLSDESDIFIAKRKRITSFKRDEIYSLDEYRCQYCGSHPEKYDLNIDHIVAVDNGGNNEDGNLITICVPCNSKKRNTDVFEFIKNNNITPLRNLSKKLDTLSKKLDTSKDKDKDKDKDKLIVESNEFIKSTLDELKLYNGQQNYYSMVVAEMNKIWKKHKPNYSFMQDVDYPALLRIGYLIGQRKGISKDDVVFSKENEIVQSFDKISLFISETDDKFFKKLTLDGIAISKNFQKIEEAMRDQIAPNKLERLEDKRISQSEYLDS